MRGFILIAEQNQSQFGENIDFFALTDMQNKVDGLSIELLYKIVHNYPELNWEWVLTGTGTMLNEKQRTLYKQRKGEGITVTYKSHNNNNNIGAIQTELQSCRELIAEKDKMIEELRRDKDKLEREKEKFWKMLEKMMGQ